MFLLVIKLSQSLLKVYIKHFPANVQQNKFFKNRSINRFCCALDTHFYLDLWVTLSRFCALPETSVGNDQTTLTVGRSITVLKADLHFDWFRFGSFGTFN